MSDWIRDTRSDWGSLGPKAVVTGGVVVLRTLRRDPPSTPLPINVYTVHDTIAMNPSRQDEPK